MLTNPKGHWNIKGNVLASAIKHRTCAAWRKVEAGAFNAAWRNGWIDEATSHMRVDVTPCGHWNVKANVMASALRHTTAVEWEKKENGAYAAARRNDWFNEATDHMKQCVSVGEFEIARLLRQFDIAFEMEKRFDGLRIVRDLRFDFYLPSFNLVIEFHGKQHFKATWHCVDLVETQRRDAIKRRFAEDEGIHYLEISDVRDIERQITTKIREIGGSTTKRDLTCDEQSQLLAMSVWTREKVIASALGYFSIETWRVAQSGAHQAAYRNGWFKEATAHMLPGRAPNGHWTKERIVKDAAEFKTKSEWVRASESAYRISKARGWFGEATAHMRSPSELRRNG